MLATLSQTAFGKPGENAIFKQSKHCRSNLSLLTATVLGSYGWPLSDFPAKNLSAYH